jgi:Secretion system C-terminal sorting domain/SprB repeat
MNRFMKSKRFLSHKGGRLTGLALVLLFSTFLTQLTAQVSVSITNKVDPSCSGYTDGSATAVATGGTAPYTYRWSNGVTGSTYSGGSGTYSVAATDVAGRSGTVSVTINNPVPVTANISFADICAGGSVTAAASGGTGPYTYNWGGGRTGATQAGLAGGSYTLVVTDSKGCLATKFVSVPGAFSVSLRIGALQCFGDCDAAIDALTSGGTAPFTYRWNTGATTAAIVGLPSGTYSVTVTDANGCTSSATGTVSNPPQIVISTSVTAPACGGGATGTATVTATGGRPPFTYKWSNGQTGSTATGLAVGDHFVTVMDAGGCNRTAKVTVASNAGFTIGLSKTDATCGGSNGSATATVTGGGRAPFTYKWSTNATTSAITGIGAGTYTVSVTDANGCVNAASITVNAAGSLNVNVTGTNAACGIANGTATATPTSGTAPFTYKWTTGATTQGITLLSSGTYSVTVTDASGCTAIGSATITTGSSIGVTIDARHVLCNGATTGQATAMVTGGSTPYTYRWNNGGNVAVIANIGAGTYIVTVTDATGCSGTQTTVLTQPSALSVTPSVTPTSCGSNNGSASISVTGGTAPYKYLWSTGSTTNGSTGLAAGSYTVTVTDNNNCTTTASITITSSNGLTLSMGSSNVTCNAGNNGTASANVTGTSGTVTYAWSNGQTTSTINGLTAGTYSVTVTSGSCSTTGSVTLTQPTAILIAISLTNPTCGSNNGSLTASASGGTPQYSYKWSNGATTASISGLASGTYFVTVTDANNCAKTTSQAIIAPNGPSATTSSTVVTCNGGSNGTATVTASGGTAPYTYNWGSGRTAASISGLAAGSYSVTVTDATGCTSVNTATVGQPDPIVITTTVTNAGCTGGLIATVTVGGNGGYTYLWSNGQTTVNATNLSAGTYSVTVTDSKGCTQAKTGIVVTGTVTTLNCLIRITQPMTGNNTNDAKAQLEAYNGQGPYTYKWSTGAVTQTVSNLSAGTITGTVTDALGCTSTCSATIVNNLCNNVTNPGVIGSSQMFCLTSEIQGLVEMTPASGGTAADAIQYLWMYSTTETTFDRSTWTTLAATGKDLPVASMPLSPIVGRISIVRCVRRANCSDFLESNVVTLTPKAFAYIIGVKNVCLGEANTFIAGDNGAGATYTWTFAGANITGSTSKSQTVTFTSLGQKTVTLTVNANGCFQTTSITVNVTTCLGVYGGFVGFNANALTDKEVMLDWATTNEIRSSRYLIEKSIDGINFDKIGEVASQNGGNNLYRFVDAEPKRGRSFYRVHQVAALGNIDVATTAAKKVLVGQNQGVLTYPNPAQSSVFVEVLDVDNAEGIIEIYNHIGSLIQTQRFDKTQSRYQVNIENLPTGTYILKIRNADGNSNSVKINKL